LLKELKKVKKNFKIIPGSKSLSESLQDFEEELVRKTLNSCNWNQSKAAKILGISEHTIRYKMKKLKINQSKF
jgi:DNA-binding NtrC family response regulator